MEFAISFARLKSSYMMVRINKGPGLYNTVVNRIYKSFPRPGTCVFRGILYIVHVNYDNYYHS